MIFTKNINCVYNYIINLIPCSLLDYTSVAIIVLSSIFFSAELRHTAGIIFIGGLLNDNVESSAIVSLICCKVTRRSTQSIAHFTSHIPPLLII